MTNIEPERTYESASKIPIKSVALCQWLQDPSLSPVEVGRVELSPEELLQAGLKFIYGDIKWHTVFLAYAGEALTIGLTPKRDDLYDWLTVDVNFNDSRIFGTSYVVTADLCSRRSLAHWEGTERQRLKDFLDKKIDADKLVPFVAPIARINEMGAEVPAINLIRRGRDVVQLLLVEASEGFTQTRCIVQPYVNTDGETLIDCIDESGNVFSRFVYQAQSDWFAPEKYFRGVVQKKAQKQAEVEASARKYVEEGGRLSEYSLRQMGRKQLADDIRWYFPGGLKALKAHLGIDQEITTEKPSKEVGTNITMANEYLRSLVFGKDDR